MAKHRQHRTYEPFADVTAGIDASRRVGWARFYREAERSHSLEVRNADLAKRQACIDDTLLPLLFELVDSTLAGHRFESFGIAYRVKSVAESYLARN